MHQLAARSKIADWRSIVEHYERSLREHGATPAGVDWPNGQDLATRFAVLIEPLAEAGERPELLDVGCGPGLLLDFLSAIGAADRVRYHGIDLSTQMVDAARRRWPKHEFSCRDIIAAPLPEQCVDVVIMNGVLTERVGLDAATITALAETLVAAAFRVARVAIAFNVMNAHVDWQRDDLFHWPFDVLADFLCRSVSRHYELRADYGLYEYTCIVRRHPIRTVRPPAEKWWVE